MPEGEKHGQQQQLLDRAMRVDEQLERSLASVVKVYVTSVEPDYSQPWSVFMEEECTGSGFALKAGGEMLIVTNAHVVASGTEIRLRKYGGVKKFKAQIQLVAHTADLALLSVEDATFWDMKALELGALPRLYENVKVVGYPMGGDNVCVTRGVVSRVDTTAYVRGAEELLVVQVDSPVNSGNSGGPALDDSGRVAGVAFSSYAGSADNIGYVIPRSVIENVLADYVDIKNTGEDAPKKKKKHETKKWPGLCNLGLATQPCENEALRAKLKMGDRTGVLVTRVARLGCGGVAGIQAGDVLLKLDGVDVANDGSVALRKSERVGAEHVITSKRAGSKVEVSVLRSGVELTLPTTLTPLPRLVPLCDGFDATPSYVVVAGLVFMALSIPLITALTDDDDDDDDEADGRADLRYLADACTDDDKADPDTQIVVWTQVLSHDCNFGYAGLCRNLPRLRAVNGVSVKNLAHLAYLAGLSSSNTTTTTSNLSNNEGSFLELDLVPANNGGASRTSVVIDAARAKTAERDILRRSMLPAPFSPDLKPLIRKYDVKKKKKLAAPDVEPPPAPPSEKSPQQQFREKNPAEPVRRASDTKKKDRENKKTPRRSSSETAAENKITTPPPTPPPVSSAPDPTQEDKADPKTPSRKQFSRSTSGSKKRQPGSSTGKKSGDKKTLRDKTPVGRTTNGESS